MARAIEAHAGVIGLQPKHDIFIQLLEHNF